MKTTDELKIEIVQTDVLIINRTEGFMGDVEVIEAYETFVRNAIEKELFTLTQNDYVGTKPTQKQFSDILSNNYILENMFDLIVKKGMLREQILENQIDKTLSMN